MATLQITKKLHIPPLIDIQSATFAEWYMTGVWWGLFGWCEHGGVLTLDGTLRPDAKTLDLIHTQDFREGHERGRWDYFTQYEEIVHTDNDLLDLLAHAEDNLYLGREQSTLRWAIGCTVGEFSGRLFPLAKPQLSIHPALSAKQSTVLQEA